MTPPNKVSAITALHRHSGFTLVEIAIGMLIVGLAAGFGLALLSAQQAQQGLSNTKARQEIIRLAVLGFVARNSRLPCPADPSLDVGAANFGVEAATPGTCTGAVPIPTAVPTAAKGVIPWVTLGISREVAIDGYQRYFTYLVTYAATSATVSTLTYLQGGIGLYSSSPVYPGLPKATSPLQNQINACSSTPGDNSCNLAAVAALISHGKNGYGAYKPGAKATTEAFPATPNVNELENANSDVALVDTGTIDTVEGGFDDMVVVWNPHDVLNTLANTGFIKSPQAVTNDRITAARRSLISYVSASGSRRAPYGSNDYTVGTQGALDGQGTIWNPVTTPTYLPWSTLGLDATAPLDGWGTPMRYAVHPNVANPGLRMSTSTGTYKNAFVVVSAGPNRTFETNLADQATPAGSDDITVSVTVGELRGLLMQTGVTIN